MQNRKIIVALVITSIFSLDATSSAYASDSSANVLPSGVTQPDAQPSASGPVLVQSRSLISATNPQSLAAAATTYGPCTLIPQNIYLRQSFGYLGVGSKATTSCTVPVTSISLTISIQKLGFFGWEGGQSWTSYNNNSASLTELAAGINCTNFKQTIWSAWMYTTVVYLGVTYTASTTAANGAQQFACGT